MVGDRNRPLDLLLERNSNNSKANPLQAWTGPEGFQEVEAPIFQDSWHMTMVRLSALRTGRL
jgi:hypothetical protein